MSSDEMFYLDEHGRKQDAALHAELLGDDATSPEDLARLIDRAVTHYGLTRAEAERVFKGGVGL